MAMADTTIPINSPVRDKLRAEKIGDETYSEVIDRLLEDPPGATVGDVGDLLRYAADIIGTVEDVAPEGDFDAEQLEEYEAEFGEVPNLREILRELEQTARTMAILAEAHREAGGEGE